MPDARFSASDFAVYEPYTDPGDYATRLRAELPAGQAQRGIEAQSYYGETPYVTDPARRARAAQLRAELAQLEGAPIQVARQLAYTSLPGEGDVRLPALPMPGATPTDIPATPEGGPDEYGNVPTDVPATPETSVSMPANVTGTGRRGNQFSQMQASDAEIAAATQQLNAGQPVTALPTQTWSLDQQRAYNERLTQFDRTAAATKLASEQAARDAAMLDQMSRVAKSSKDIAVALQQQDEIGFRNAVAAGVPAVQALTRYPRAASSSMVALAKAASPTEMAPAPSSVTLPNGMTGVRSGVHGEHFTFAPGQEPPMATPKPEDVGGGVSVFRVSPQHFQVVTKPPPTPKEGSLNDTQKATLTDLRREETAIRSTLPTRVTNPAYIAATNRLAEIKASRDAILNGGTPVSGGSPATKPLTKAQAADFIKQAGGDKDKARKLARDAGFTF